MECYDAPDGPGHSRREINFLQSLFHVEISLQEYCTDASPAMILWSRDGSSNTSLSGWYQPNHFVPPVRSHCGATNLCEKKPSKVQPSRAKDADGPLEKEYEKKRKREFKVH